MFVEGDVGERTEGKVRSGVRIILARLGNFT
jgi:hypothetical protein